MNDRVNPRYNGGSCFQPFYRHKELDIIVSALLLRVKTNTIQAKCIHVTDYA